MKGVSTFYRKKRDGSLSWGYRLDMAPVGGKRTQTSKSGFKSKRDAEKAGVRAFLQYENAGDIVQPSDMSFADFLDLWLEKDCAIDLKPETVKNYRKKVNNHIKPALGSYHLCSLKRENLQAFIVDMFHKGYSKNTLSSISGVLSKSLNWAVDNRYLLYSPAVRIKIPKNTAPAIPTRTSNREYISAESMEKIFKRFPEGHASHLPLRIGYECGMRIGEVFGLVWEDIDLEHQTITVNRQVQWEEDKNRTTEEKLLSNGHSECGNGYWYFTNPKYNSFRVIDISRSLTELLCCEKHRQEAMRKYYQDLYKSYHAERPLYYDGKGNATHGAPNPIGTTGNFPAHLVLVRPDGTYISSRTMQHTVRVIKSIIPENFKFHDLRHTHISMLYENGANEKYIQERTGHKDLYITRDYVRLSDVSTEQGKAVLNGMFDTAAD